MFSRLGVDGKEGRKEGGYLGLVEELYWDSNTAHCLCRFCLVIGGKGGKLRW